MDLWWGCGTPIGVVRFNGGGRGGGYFVETVVLDTQARAEHWPTNPAKLYQLHTSLMSAQTSAQTPLGRCKWREQQMVNSRRRCPNVQITLWLMSSASGWGDFRAPRCGGELIRTKTISLFSCTEGFRFLQTRKIRREDLLWGVYLQCKFCLFFFNMVYSLILNCPC